MCFIPGSSDPFMMLLIPILLGVIGFLVAGFAKGIVNIILIVMGVLGGAAAIVMGFLKSFQCQYRFAVPDPGGDRWCHRLDPGQAL